VPRRAERSVNGLFVIERAPEVGDAASSKSHQLLDRPEVTAACCVPVTISDIERASAAARIRKASQPAPTARASTSTVPTATSHSLLTSNAAR
jgi:hypothetical protein